MQDGHVFYERQAPGVGDYFLDSLFADIDSLVLYGGIHPKPDGRFHRALAKRFPYAIYYQLDGKLVIVVAILDCRRNPTGTRDNCRKGNNSTIADGPWRRCTEVFLDTAS